MAKWSSFSKMDQHGHSQDQESFQYVFFKSSADGGKILSTAQCVLCKVYFSAQPNKLRPILKFKKYYPIEHIFVLACSSARKIHFFKF